MKKYMLLFLLSLILSPYVAWASTQTFYGTNDGSTPYYIQVVNDACPTDHSSWHKIEGNADSVKFWETKTICSHDTWRFYIGSTPTEKGHYQGYVGGLSSCPHVYVYYGGESEMGVVCGS